MCKFRAKLFALIKFILALHKWLRDKFEHWGLQNAKTISSKPQNLYVDPSLRLRGSDETMA